MKACLKIIVVLLCSFGPVFALQRGVRCLKIHWARKANVFVVKKIAGVSGRVTGLLSVIPTPINPPKPVADGSSPPHPIRPASFSRRKQFESFKLLC